MEGVGAAGDGALLVGAGAGSGATGGGGELAEQASVATTKLRDAQDAEGRMVSERPLPARRV